MLPHNQLKQARQKYYATLNRLNLLLLKQHGFKKQKAQYQLELDNICLLIDKVKEGRKSNMDIQNQGKSQQAGISSINKNKRNSLPMYIISQDNYLRSFIKSNAQQIKTLQRKLQGKQMVDQVKLQNDQMQKYRQMISSQFQNGIQQKLSMIRGKVDDLKKKIKQLNKQISCYQQEHMEQMDDYSLKLKSLEDYKKKNMELRNEIKLLKQRKDNLNKNK